MICLVIGYIALCFNVYHLGTPSIWFDEALSIERAHQSLPVLWKIIFTTQPNMALYYLGLHFWLSFTNLFGWLPTESVVRFPSAIFAALSAVSIYLFGRRFMRRSVGLISAGLYVINPLQLTYAQETRSYSMQLLLVCCSWYALLAAQTSNRQQRWWWCYALANALAIYTQLFSVFSILAQIITYCCLTVLPTAWQKQFKHRYLAFSASLASVFVAILPLLIASRHANKTGWLPAPHVSDIVHLLVSIAGNKKAYVVALSLACTLTILSMLSILLTRMIRRRSLADQHEANNIQCSPEGTLQSTSTFSTTRRPWLDIERIPHFFPVTLALLCWFVIPIVISYGVSLGSMRLFSTRYLVIIVPPFLCLTALGIEILSRQMIRISLIAMFFIMAISCVPFYYQHAQVEDWKEATFWLQSRHQLHDGIVCYDNAQGCQLDIEYYLLAYPRGIVFPADSPGSFPWVSYDLTNLIEANPAQAVDPTALATYGARHPRVFFITARLPSEKSVARAASARHWLESHYRLQDQIVTRTVTIRLYQTAPPQHSLFAGEQATR